MVSGRRGEEWGRGEERGAVERGVERGGRSEERREKR